ncbi:hypothetical protein CVT24_003926 [Panaeolus cyanescens]|uniref:Uncharacterized protein n=1 Tax=Panaeolus cyanescens TaxID=181874 RepID=A0A409W844_9AGAR|nr:hypothetical protein CVT24_003926 [Panaeolus cyanescens]
MPDTTTAFPFPDLPLDLVSEVIKHVAGSFPLPSETLRPKSNNDRRSLPSGTEVDSDLRSKMGAMCLISHTFLTICRPHVFHEIDISFSVTSIGIDLERLENLSRLLNSQPILARAVKSLTLSLDDCTRSAFNTVFQEHKSALTRLFNLPNVTSMCISMLKRTEHDTYLCARCSAANEGTTTSLYAKSTILGNYLTRSVTTLTLAMASVNLLEILSFPSLTTLILHNCYILRMSYDLPNHDIDTATGFNLVEYRSHGTKNNCLFLLALCANIQRIHIDSKSCHQIDEDDLLLNSKHIQNFQTQTMPFSQLTEGHFTDQAVYFFTQAEKRGILAFPNLARMTFALEKDPRKEISMFRTSETPLAGNPQAIFACMPQLSHLHLHGDSVHAFNLEKCLKPCHPTLKFLQIDWTPMNQSELEFEIEALCPAVIPSLKELRLGVSVNLDVLRTSSGFRLNLSRFGQWMKHIFVKHGRSKYPELNTLTLDIQLHATVPEEIDEELQEAGYRERALTSRPSLGEITEEDVDADEDISEEEREAMMKEKLEKRRAMLYRELLESTIGVTIRDNVESTPISSPSLLTPMLLKPKSSPIIPFELVKEVLECHIDSLKYYDAMYEYEDGLQLFFNSEPGTTSNAESTSTTATVYTAALYDGVKKPTKLYGPYNVRYFINAMSFNNPIFLDMCRGHVFKAIDLGFRVENKAAAIHRLKNLSKFLEDNPSMRERVVTVKTVFSNPWPDDHTAENHRSIPNNDGSLTRLFNLPNVVNMVISHDTPAFFSDLPRPPYVPTFPSNNTLLYGRNTLLGYYLKQLRTLTLEHIEHIPLLDILSSSPILETLILRGCSVDQGDDEIDLSIDLSSGKRFSIVEYFSESTKNNSLTILALCPNLKRIFIDSASTYDGLTVDDQRVLEAMSFDELVEADFGGEADGLVSFFTSGRGLELQFPKLTILSFGIDTEPELLWSTVDTSGLEDAASIFERMPALKGVRLYGCSVQSLNIAECLAPRQDTLIGLWIDWEPKGDDQCVENLEEYVKALDTIVLPGVIEVQIGVLIYFDIDEDKPWKESMDLSGFAKKLHQKFVVRGKDSFPALGRLCLNVELYARTDDEGPVRDAQGIRKKKSQSEEVKNKKRAYRNWLNRDIKPGMQTAVRIVGEYAPFAYTSCVSVPDSV